MTWMKKARSSRKMYCEKCKHKFAPFEYLVETEKGKHLCETCFFDEALEKLNAKSKKMDYQGYRIEEEENAENAD